MRTQHFESALRAAALAAAMLTVAASAQAEATSWKLAGTVDQLEDALGELPPSVGVGDAFNVVLNFDTAAPVTNPGGCGAGAVGSTCRHNGSSNQNFTHLVINGLALAGQFDANPPGNNSIIVRNNAAWTYDSAATTVDGYSFSTQENYLDNNGALRAYSMLVVFRGNEDLNVVTDGTLLPALPPAGLLSLRQRVYEVCEGAVGSNGIITDCSGLFISGTINAVSAVPEPGTVALLCAGIVGIGAMRRRR